MAVGGQVGSHSIHLGSDEVFQFQCNLCTDYITWKEGIAYCVDCTEYLCKSCLTNHNRVKVTASHNILQGSTFTPGKQHGGQPQPAREIYPDNTTAVPGTLNCLSADLRDRRISKVGEYKVMEDCDRCAPWIAGIVVLDDGRLIICDFNIKKVKLLNADFKLLFSLKGHTGPCGVVIISDSVVAVTLPLTQQLQYVTVSAQGLKTDRIQNIDRNCYGITRYKDKLYTTCHCPGEVLVLDLEGQVLHSCGGKDLFNVPYYITVGRDGLLYVSDTKRNTITCLSLEGKTVYQHVVKSLDFPSHILVDDENYVYISDLFNNNIQIITPAGDLYRELIKEEFGLGFPICMAYIQSDRTLVVGKNTQLVLVYRFQ